MNFFLVSFSQKIIFMLAIGSLRLKKLKKNLDLGNYFKELVVLRPDIHLELDWWKSIKVDIVFITELVLCKNCSNS